MRPPGQAGVQDRLRKNKRRLSRDYIAQGAENCDTSALVTEAEDLDLALNAHAQELSQCCAAGPSELEAWHEAEAGSQHAEPVAQGAAHHLTGRVGSRDDCRHDAAADHVLPA